MSVFTDYFVFLFEPPRLTTEFFCFVLFFCPQVNDFVRGKTRQKDGSIPLSAEILAGGCVSYF